MPGPCCVDQASLNSERSACLCFPSERQTYCPDHPNSPLRAFWEIIKIFFFLKNYDQTVSISGVCGLFGDIWNGCGFSITSSPLFSQKLSAIPVSAFCDSLSKPQFEKLVRFCFIKVSFCSLTKVSCIPTYEAPFFLFLKMIYKVTFFKIWLGAMKLTVSQYSASVCCYCCFQFTYSFVVSWDRVSLCGPGCPLTHDNPLVSVLQVLGTTILESLFMRGTNIILHPLLAYVDRYLHTGILTRAACAHTDTFTYTWLF